MTQSVTIVNSSNWDGEPIIVDGMVLQPGEYAAFGLDQNKALKPEIAAGRSPQIARPFGIDRGETDHVNQVLPSVRVVWEEAGGMTRRGDDAYTPKEPT